MKSLQKDHMRLTEASESRSLPDNILFRAIDSLWTPPQTHEKTQVRCRHSLCGHVGRKDASVGCPSFPRVGFVPRVASGLPDVPSPNRSSEPVWSAANVATCFSSGSKRDPHSSRALQLSSPGRVDVSDSLDPLRLPRRGLRGNLGTEIRGQTERFLIFV